MQPKAETAQDCVREFRLPTTRTVHNVFKHLLMNSDVQPRPIPVAVVKVACLVISDLEHAINASICVNAGCDIKDYTVLCCNAVFFFPALSLRR